MVQVVIAYGKGDAYQPVTITYDPELLQVLDLSPFPFVEYIPVPQALSEPEPVVVQEPPRSPPERAQPSQPSTAALSASEVFAIASQYPWDANVATCIIMRESGGKPWIVSKTNDHGLGQMNAPTWRPYFGEERWSHVYEPEANVAMMFEAYERNGWGPWIAPGVPIC